MGREIRKVAPNWEHPKQDCRHVPQCGRCFKPLYEGADYEQRKNEFEEKQKTEGLQAAIDWCGQAPDQNDYAPAWTEEEATHYQMYETVSEGTPVSPVFATKQELADYLVAHGDYWDQQRGHGARSRAAADAFVNEGFSMSMVVAHGKIYDGIDALVIPSSGEAA